MAYVGGRITELRKDMKQWIEPDCWSQTHLALNPALPLMGSAASRYGPQCPHLYNGATVSAKLMYGLEKPHGCYYSGVKEEEREELMGSAMQTTDKVSRKCQML